MRFRPSLILLIALSVAGTLTLRGAADNAKAPAFQFQEVAYFPRWSNNEQHEFTPDKQEDLDRWTDMITINGYPDVHDGDGLAATANTVLANYKSHEGKILRTNSVPQTADRPAEHFIAVMFSRPAFVEVAFARFKMIGNKGHSFVYSHRIYGSKADESINSWMSANSVSTEKALMEWDAEIKK